MDVEGDRGAPSSTSANLAKRYRFAKRKRRKAFHWRSGTVAALTVPVLVFLMLTQGVLVYPIYLKKALTVKTYHWSIDLPASTDVQLNYTLKEAIQERYDRKQSKQHIRRANAYGSIENWYNPGEKYFAFQTSGGISNQRKILEWGIVVSKLLNRTLIIPPVAPHTSLFGNYNRQTDEDISPADSVYGIDRLMEYLPVVIIDGMFKKFLQAFRNKHGVIWETVQRNLIDEKILDQWDKDKIIHLFGESSSDVLFFGQGTMWRNFNFSTSDMLEVQQHLRFHPDLRHLSRVLAGKLPGRKFNCIHIRFSDGDDHLLFRKNLLRPASSFLARMDKANFPSYANNLYIATIPKKHMSPYFNKIKKRYNVTFSKDLPQTMLKGLLLKYPANLRVSILSVVEQMICARAERFIGTGFSTLSDHIKTLRNNRAWIEDPLLTQTANDDEILAEIEMLSKSSNCTSSNKVC